MLEHKFGTFFICYANQVIKSYTTVVLLNKICHLIVLKVIGFY